MCVCVCVCVCVDFGDLVPHGGGSRERRSDRGRFVVPDQWQLGIQESTYTISMLAQTSLEFECRCLVCLCCNFEDMQRSWAAHKTFCVHVCVLIM